MIGQKVYKIGSRRGVLPAIGRPDEAIPEIEKDSFDYRLDRGLAVLKHLLVENNPVNRHFVIKNESVAQSFIEITAKTITGDGLAVNVPNHPQAQEIIRGFNNMINIRGETVDDFIAESWKDNITHASSVYRLRVDPELPFKVDAQRLDQRTLTPDYDVRSGWRRWVQRISLNRPTTNFKSKNRFYNSRFIRYGVFGNLGIKQYYIAIPNEPNSCIHVSHFSQPPVTAAMNLLKYKIWILWFMRKYSEKHWAPFLVGTVGDTKNNFFPYSEPELQKEIDDLSATLVKVRDFAAVAIPGYNKIEALKTETAKSSQVYVEYLQHLNEEIMYALFGSMGQRTSTGNYVASSTVLDEAWLRFIKGIRRNYTFALRRFYVKSLLPLNGVIDVKEEDINLEWSQLKTESRLQTMQSIEIAAKIGAFNDRQELRDVAASVFSALGNIPAEGGGYDTPDIEARRQAPGRDFKADNMGTREISP